MSSYDEDIRKAIRHFWQTRGSQQARQGAGSGRRDHGDRSAVTGGAQLQGFVELFRDILLGAGMPRDTVVCDRRSDMTIPGFFRPTKNWDLIVVAKKRLFGCLEFKSQIGSFGNNYNNRTEEAVGNATDLWTAYREGAYQASPRPWAGYMMLLEETRTSTTPVAALEKHFPVLPEFRGASYAKRYELLCQKLVRERLYDATCLLLTNRDSGPTGYFREPNEEVGFTTFAESLLARAIAFARAK